MLGDHQGKPESKQKPSTSCLSALIMAYQQIYFLAYLYPKTLAVQYRAMFPTQREIPSARKLQQLPWTTVFENLQLLLRSSDAPGPTP